MMVKLLTKKCPAKEPILTLNLSTSFNEYLQMVMKDKLFIFAVIKIITIVIITIIVHFTKYVKSESF